VAVSNVELIVNAVKAINPLRKVEQQSKKVEGAVRDMNGRLRDSKGRFVAVGKSATQASKGVNKLTASIKGLLTVAAVIGTAKFIIFKTAELETQTRSLQVLTGSAQTAKNIIQELQDIGAVTPFTGTELIETAKRLRAFGVDTEKLVETTRRLGDVAGATGADLSGIATAYGQIQAKGKLQTEELLQLQERGVDLAGVLKEEYKLTGEEFSKALQKGQISAEAAEFALKKLTDTGGQYANGAISQSDTLAGKFSTLVDGIERIARKIGQALTPALQNVLSLAIQTVDRINQAFAAGSISNQDKQAFREQAIQEVRRFAGPMPGGPFGAGEVVVRHLGKTYKGPASSVVSQITNDLINREVRRRTEAARGSSAKAPMAVTLPPLIAGTNDGTGKKKKGRAGKSDAEREAERQAEILRRQREQADAMLLSLKQEALLTGDITEQQRASLEHAIEKFNLARQFPQLTENELQVLRNQLDTNFQLLQADKDRIEQQKMLEKAQRKAQEAERKRAEELRNLYQGIGDTIADGVTNALKGAVDGTKSLADASTSLLNDLANQLLQVARNMLFFGNISGTLTGGSGILGSLFSGFLANGGTAMGGRSYIVGEKGPELFTPGRTGSVTPNNALGGANIVVNVDASGSQAQGSEPNAKALGAAIGAAVQAELVKQKRPGGLLS